MLVTLSRDQGSDQRAVADALRFQSLFSLTASGILLATFLFRLQMGLFSYPSGPVLIGGLLLLLAALAGMVAATSARPVRRMTLTLVPIVQLMVVLAMIYNSGGIGSSLLTLLLLPAISAMFISLPFAVGICLAAVALFIAMLSGAEAGWWSFVERSGLTSAQQSAINVLRLILLLGITVSGMFLLLMHHMRRVYRLLETREDDLFAVVQQAEETFAEALAVADDAAAVQRALSAGQERLRETIAQLADESIPLVRILNVIGSPSCHACKERIPKLSFYYGIPTTVRAARLMGTVRNDLHCRGCHQKRSDGTCQVCTMWTQVPS